MTAQETATMVSLTIVTILLLCYVAVLLWRRYKPVRKKKNSTDQDSQPVKVVDKERFWSRFWPHIVGAAMPVTLVTIDQISASAVPLEAWVALITVATILIVFGKKESPIRNLGISSIATMVVLFVVSLTPWFKYGYDEFSCLKNTTEQSSRCQPKVAPEVVQPLKFTDGMILNLKPGDKQLIILAGKIKVINYERGHCLAFTPDEVAKREYESGNVEAWVTPLGSTERTVIIQKLRPGEGRCPRLRY